MNGEGNGVERMLDRLDERISPESPVMDRAAGLARRFITAYGEPDYRLWRTSCSLCFEWEHYAIDFDLDDGHIMFTGDGNGEMLLDSAGHVGRLARIGSAIREALRTATQTAKDDGMRQVTFPTLTAFHPDMQRADKQQIVKILEETAELSFAANDYRKGEGSREHMADELADVLQTLANFVDAYQLSDDELAAAVKRVTAHNRERGRYQPGERRMF